MHKCNASYTTIYEPLNNGKVVKGYKQQTIYMYNK